MTNFHHNRALGQNFLCDETVIHRIVSAVEIAPGDHVLEIGPGLGALTKPLAASGVILDCFEIDKRLEPYLKPLLDTYPRLSVHFQDVRKVRLNEFCLDGEVVKVCANLPYVFTQPIIEQLMLQVPFASSVTLMLQKEALVRLSATSGSKTYNRTAIFMDLLWQKVHEFEVSSLCFHPAPDVSSCVVTWKRKELAITQVELAELWHLLGVCFAQRRKQLQSVIKATQYAYILEKLSDMGYTPAVRAEVIPPTDWLTLYRSNTVQ